jgi:Tfp pilus assembly protein PilO
MIKLTKAQRDQLLAVAIAAVGVMAALWYFVVLAQGRELAATRASSVKMTTKLKDASAKMIQLENVGRELTNCLEKLKAREATFAPEHDPYSWMVGVMGRFSLPASDLHRFKSVSNIDFKLPEISDKGLLGGFPYKWAKFHITGQGRYHDLGKFIADFENAFPYFRIQDLDIGLPSIRQDPEMLAFNFDIVAPLAPSGGETK